MLVKQNRKTYMDKEILFDEKQKFSQWWLWAILVSVNGLLLFGVFKQIINGEQFGDKPISNVGLLSITVSVILLTVLFISLRWKQE
jgi:hypothetical protein